MRLLAAVPRVQIHRILRPGLFWLHLVTIRGAAAAGDRGGRRAAPAGLAARGVRGGAGWARGTAWGAGELLQRPGASAAQQAARTLDEATRVGAGLRRRWLSGVGPGEHNQEQNRGHGYCHVDPACQAAQPTVPNHPSLIRHLVCHSLKNDNKR